MSCPGTVDLNGVLVFGIKTHNPDTGALVDADSTPTYRLYQNKADTPILTGTMTKQDDLNTVGFYTELINCTPANGFAYGGNYTIDIDAVVAGTRGGITYTFRITNDIWGYPSRTLTQSVASVVAAMTGTTIVVYRGTTISIALASLGNISLNTKLYFTVKADVGSADAQAIFQIERTSGLLRLTGVDTPTSGDGTIIVDDAVLGNITVGLAASSSAQLPVGTYYYDVKMVTASGVQELSVGGYFSIHADVTRAVS